LRGGLEQGLTLGTLVCGQATIKFPEVRVLQSAGDTTLRLCQGGLEGNVQGIAFISIEGQSYVEL
jgi:hypothetical protein